MAVKYIKEANNNVDPKIQREHDALTNAGFNRMIINTYGTKVEPTDIAYEMEADDVLYQIMYEDSLFGDGKPGYALLITGDGEDVFVQNKSPMSLASLIKISKLAKKYFAEYPATAKFMKRFADEYDMSFSG